MAENLEQYTLDLASKITRFETEYSIKNVGKVVEAGDGIARVTGLTDVRSQ
jgi:F0F1-type ATP synthase alpha subunit